MIATLRFKLPEERDDHEKALNGWRYAAALDDLFSKIRAWDKYENKETVTLEELRAALVEILEDNEVPRG